MGTKTNRTLTLLSSNTTEKSGYATYNQSGDEIITRKMTKSSIGFELSNDTKQTGRVWVNDEQYFENVPLEAWEFYIAALTETARLMQKIDKIEIE